MCMLLNTAAAQAVRARQLLFNYGAGLGRIDLRSNAEGLGSHGSLAGSVRFSVSYATGPHFAIGYQFERLGSTEHPGLLDRYRLSMHQLTMLVRPWVRERWLVELSAGLGPSTAVSSPRNARLQARASTGNVGAGVSWLRMLSGTMGLRVGAEIGAAPQEALNLEGAPVTDEKGEVVNVGWSAWRAGVGLVVRF